MPLPPKKCDEPSVFTAENLLREARRQKSTPNGSVPEICLLDPDGDIVRHLLAKNRAAKCPYWACYHTDLYLFEQEGFQFGVLGCAVGASYAVLVAEASPLGLVRASRLAADWAGPRPWLVLNRVHRAQAAEVALAAGIAARLG